MNSERILNSKMNLKELLQLDRSLEHTWKIYEQFLKSAIKVNALEKAAALVDYLPDAHLVYTSGDFVLYAALVYVYNEEYDKALSKVQDAYLFGYRGFWQFDPESNGWGTKESEEYLMLKPLHENNVIQKYVKSVYEGSKQSLGFDIEKTPFCWFEKTILDHKSGKCHISNNKLEKGKWVYQFRFFNGSFDVPAKYFIANIETFDSHKGAANNKKKYLGNAYTLSDYNSTLGYKHPLINSFWNTLNRFDLKDTLDLIACPPVHSTPYTAYSFNDELLPVYNADNKEDTVERKINFGTGGEFINLLYILIKCGYWNDILHNLPGLPEHFPVTLMVFGSDYIRNAVSDYLGLPMLPDLYQLALKNYSLKKFTDTKKLIDFGDKYPDFRQRLAHSLNYYEYHLYSNYHPGINWLFQDFKHFSLAHGGGLLDFLVADPSLIPVLKFMKETHSYPQGLSHGAVDAYQNSFPFLYRTVTLNNAFYDPEYLSLWMNMPLYIRNSPYFKRFKSIHQNTMKIIQEHHKRKY